MSNEEIRTIEQITSSPSTTTLSDAVPTTLNGSSKQTHDDYRWSADESIFKEIVPGAAMWGFRFQRDVTFKDSQTGQKVSFNKGDEWTPETQGNLHHQPTGRGFDLEQLELVDDTDANATATATSKGMADHA